MFETVNVDVKFGEKTWNLNLAKSPPSQLSSHYLADAVNREKGIFYVRYCPPLCHTTGTVSLDSLPTNPPWGRQYPFNPW